MAEQLQSYKNHLRWFPLYHFFVVPILLLNALNAVRHVFLTPNRSTIFAMLVAFALVSLGHAARVMALTVQDRVIRLEMRLRLSACLPPDLRGRIGDLTLRQLTALRFASDAELGDMVRDVLAGKLATPRDIKMRVKDWQGDFLRA